MKVLLTGEKGKFVSVFEEYIIEKYPNIEVSKISLRGSSWKKTDFGQYDAIVHCAGIIYSERNSYEEYKQINVDLTRELCGCIRNQDIGMFIYLSSMAVYDGVGWGFGKDGIITEETKPKQRTYYGKSKYEAELAALEILNNSKIRLAIVRAPSIVGKEMENYFGRYVKLSAFPFIPIPNIHKEAKRSFVYVDTLIDFILLIIHEEKKGVYYPQNLPQLSVAEMYETICRVKKRRRFRSAVLYHFLPAKIKKRVFQQICYSDVLSKDENITVGKISSYDAIRYVLQEYEGNK